MVYRHYSYVARLAIVLFPYVIESITGGTGVITMATLMMVTLCCFLTFLF